MKSLVCLTPPTQEPVTLDDVLAFMRVDESDNPALVESLLVAAREKVERTTNRALLTQTWLLTLSAWPAGHGYAGRLIELDRSPLASVTSVKYYPADGSAQQTLAAEAYHTLARPQPGVLCLRSGWTWPALADRPDAVEVTFVAGVEKPSDVPERIKQAIRMLVAYWHDMNRTGVNIGNIVNQLPDHWDDIILQHRVGGWIA